MDICSSNKTLPCQHAAEASKTIRFKILLGDNQLELLFWTCLKCDRMGKEGTSTIYCSTRKKQRLVFEM